MVRDPTPLPIETFDMDCDLTIRPRRLAEQFKDKMDRTIGCGDLKTVEQVIKTARTRWGGHTDLQIELTSLRVYETQLRHELEEEQSTPDQVPRTAVLGCGYMGSRVAAELALCGHNVQVFDVLSADEAVERVANALADAEQSGILGQGSQVSADRASALRRITVASSVADAVKDCRLVIEAVVDDLTTKSGVYSDAVRNCRSDAVLATTSMNFPLSQIQELLPANWQRRLVGLRFLAPVVGIALVEVTHLMNSQNGEVKEVCDMFCAMQKTLIQGSADAERGEPYIGPGYETITDLLNAGLTDEELAPFALKPKAKQMVMAQIAAGAGGARTEIVD